MKTIQELEALNDDELRVMPNAKFGRLTVVAQLPDRKNRQIQWDCQCECGKQTTALTTDLRRGHTRSCGCLRAAANKQGKTIHGHASRGPKSPEYNSWNGMRNRCSNPKSKEYADYGGRGITFYDPWRSFKRFLSDMGSQPKGTSLGRVDNNGPYAPWNCRWETPTQQSLNRRSNIRITLDGIEKCASEWADEIGIKRTIVYDRLRAGWSHRRALFTPARQRTIALILTLQ